MDQIRVDPTRFEILRVANGVLFTIVDPYESKSYQMVFQNNDDAVKYLAKEILFASPKLNSVIEKALKK